MEYTKAQRQEFQDRYWKLIFYKGLRPYIRYAALLIAIGSAFVFPKISVLSFFGLVALADFVAFVLLRKKESKSLAPFFKKGKYFPATKIDRYVRTAAIQHKD